MATTTHAAADTVVEIAGLTKTYGSLRAVDDISFAVRRGEIFGVLGSNGAGKTTAVECAQGIRRATSGNVRVLGLDPIKDRGQLRGRVGSQLQDSNLPDRLRVNEAIRLFADDDAQATAAIEDWELGPLTKSAFGDLSGGQRQRLFLALALLNRPEVVFLDELTQGLDPNARRTVWGLIERVRDSGTTVVLVTHFMEEAEVLCDRVTVMASGEMVDSGTPDELIQRHGQGVRMRFAARPEDAAWIGSLPGVSSVEVRNDELEATGESPMIAHIGAALVSRDQVPASIRVEQPDLESALINLLQPSGVQQ